MQLKQIIWVAFRLKTNQNYNLAVTGIPFLIDDKWFPDSKIPQITINNQLSSVMH